MTVAKPDVASLTARGAKFIDGSTQEVDVVLLATGYEFRIPFIDEALLRWKDGHPQLYLNIFSREHDTLYILGCVELADAAYKRFDEMAQLVVLDIRARETGVGKDELNRLKREDTPDLRGGMKYIDSPRHSHYVNSQAYQDYLAGLRDRFDWPDITRSTFRPGRVQPEAAPSEVSAEEVPVTEVPVKSDQQAEPPDDQVTSRSDESASRPV
jgi:hypothetical protein